MRAVDWFILNLLIVSSGLFLVNFMLTGTPVVGIVASILFISGASTVLGRLLFANEDRIFRVFLGLATLLVVLALVGMGLVFLAHFTETLSLVVLIAISASLGFALVRVAKKNPVEASTSTSMKETRKEEKIESVALVLPFAFSVVLAFVLLWFSRTGEGGSSVWLTIPNYFVAVYLIGAFALFLVLFFANLRQSVKLVAVCVFSFLSHSLFLLVWYPGRYGDPWSHLGEIRYIVKTGMPYAYSSILQNHLWVDILKFKAEYTLIVFFERMFNFDLYWIHVLFGPVLWSVFVPLLAYKITDMLAAKRSKVFPLLAALVTVAFPSLVAWGTVTVPNSVGFVFFFLSVALFLLWMNQGGFRIWFIALLAATTSFFVHPQSGSFAFTFFFFGTIVQKTSRKMLWAVGLLPSIAFYPLALYLNRASFTTSGLFQISNFLAFQSEISTLLLIFGLVGLVLGIRGKLLHSKPSLLFFLFYLIIISEYYFTKYGMSNLPYGPGRIVAMADLLLVPFVAMGFLALIGPLRKAFSHGSNSASLHFSFREINLGVNPRALGLLLVGLFLSAQAASVLFQAYPQSEIVKVQPSAYELDAIRFIDSIDSNASRYVVLCDTTFASLAAGFLGADYTYGAARGLFGPPEYSYATKQMYLTMTNTPSIGILQQAMGFAKAEVSYFVVSVRDPNLDRDVERTLEVLPIYRVFGDGKLYVFRYPLPVFRESGSVVRVVFDDGLGGEQDVQTTSVYMVESEITSILTVSGHSSYNVTEFPMHWTFLGLMVNNVSRPFDASSDINAFIYVKGLQPSDSLTIKWLFSRKYADVGWKEDSFKDLNRWRTHDFYKGTIVPDIASDGNVLSMSYSFAAGSYQYYYYVTSVNISTNDYPYLLMRYKCDRPVAVSSVYFELGSGQQIITLGSASSEWSTIVVPLTPNSFVRTVMVGLSNARDQSIRGPATSEIDYILFSAKTAP